MSTNCDSRSGSHDEGRDAALAIAGLTLLRLTTGAIMVAHGVLKLEGFSRWEVNAHQLGLPLPEVTAHVIVACELGGGLALALGLVTPLAAAAIACVMATAIATVHAGHGFFAADGGWEYPLLVAVIALYFVARGAGPVSLDALLRRDGKGEAPQEPRPVVGDRRIQDAP